MADDKPSVGAPVELEHRGRQGFLPIETNTFDRGFIGVVLLVAIHLVWMRFLEASLPLGIATIISVVLLVIIIRYG